MGRGTRTAVAHASSQDIRSMLRSRSSGAAPSWADGAMQIPAAPGGAPDLDFSTDAGILEAAMRVEMVPNGIDFRGASGVNILNQSAALHDPTSPTDKAYRGYVGVRQGADGEMEFIGITTHGPGNRPTAQGSIEASGRNLDAVIDAVNKKITSKLKKYEVRPGTGPTRVDRSAVIENIKQRADR